MRWNMKRREFFQNVGLGSALILHFDSHLGNIAALPDADAEGIWVEGCTCNVACPCAFTGKFATMCQGAVANVVKLGVYNGVDLTGAKLVWAGHAGNWSYLYVDATEQQKKAAEALATAAFGPLGKVESLRGARIDVSGEGGRYKVTVDGGKILELTTEPVLGGDQKTPIVHSNTVVGTVLQARTLSGSFRDGQRSFKWANTNSYFNPATKLGPMPTSSK
jgi:hypothetical protein